MKTFVGVSLFIIGEFLFDYFTNSRGKCGNCEILTNWSITYFTLTYTGMLLICWDQVFLRHSKILIFSFLSFIAFFGYIGYYELTLINVPYDQYLISISNRFFNNLKSILFISAFLIITFMVWEKYLSKK